MADPKWEDVAQVMGWEEDLPEGVDVPRQVWAAPAEFESGVAL